ncbi:polyribonucleotide nucleotidyltransferase [Hippea maritima]|uniref:Polyribonucleotide nucleotidyltransferase n=1 Tax=Hippea maritima (strain ATCC 700847 / DSM 10411 / MH2) TaxID=760142 RepID=F2LUM9_HIPMA|nr:polyribonucleotide nucleotidyltransferase [Hippea maritima]AEA34619.1 Polyribonucleotide nucleotidyltransferase [Hippea maritima DSM 10411]
MTIVERTINGKKLTIETGWYAKQADGACVIRMGDTMVLATAVSSKEPPKEFLDFLPLTVNYQERFYAAGKIPGGFVKREGKPTVHETLVSRLIDRSIRPLFPKDYKQEIQVIITTISADQENDPAIISILAASCSLCLSDIPFLGPVAGVRVSRFENGLKAFASLKEIDDSRLNLILAGTKDAINMIEAGAGELSEDEMVDAIMFGKDNIDILLDAQEEIIKKAAKPKREYIPIDVSEDIVNKIEAFAADELMRAVNIKEKKKRNSTIEAIFNKVKEKVVEEFEDEDFIEEKTAAAFEDVVKNIVRTKIINTGVRIDGRGLDEIRPITCEVGVLPRAHGSAVFTRGETQALVATTLGSREDAQIIDDVSEEGYERFMLHYNFLPFSTGEVKRLGPPGRREIGHGNLAKRAIEPMLPSEDDFPYAIRVVSDILESNGSSSMATVCGSTLSLMDAGVPIKKPVSGVAMGLIKYEGGYAILTDILGDEDHYGDMDFKVAGTKDGITALQMDIKITGVDAVLLKEALYKAKEARLFILNKMLAVLDSPRPDISPYAPQIRTLTIEPEKIKDLIGPGGKTIKSIIERTNVKIDINPDGKINVYGTMDSKLDEAMEIIKSLTTTIKEGDVIEGVVTRIEKYGAFIKLLPNKEGLLHISQISNDRVSNIYDVLNIGDKIRVKVTNIDELGRIALSRKILLNENPDEDKKD